MEYRLLGGSGLMVPVLSYGTATFAGEGENAWGKTQVAEATRLVDISLEAGMNFFDTADVYSSGRSGTVLGEAVKGRRDQVLITTKAAFRSEAGPNGLGTSRYHLIRACESSLRRLQTDYIDLYTLHGFDAMTPVEENSTLRERLQDVVHGMQFLKTPTATRSNRAVSKSSDGCRLPCLKPKPGLMSCSRLGRRTNRGRWVFGHRAIRCQA